MLVYALCMFAGITIFWCPISDICSLTICRLYVRGSILGYKRGKSNQYPSTSLIQIEGVNTVEEVNWYLGKRVAYVYKAKTKKNGTLYRSMWGRVIKPHGNSGVVRATFRKNLPPSSLGGRVRVFMYPSRIWCGGTPHSFLKQSDSCLCRLLGSLLSHSCYSCRPLG